VGKNDTLYILLGVGGFLYFYNKNAGFKAKIDSLLSNLHIPGASGALSSFDPIGGKGSVSSQGTGEINSSDVGDLTSTHSENCTAAYGGNCTAACNKGDQEDCDQCHIECGASSGGGGSDEPAGNTDSSTGKLVPKVGGCAKACDVFRSASPSTYATCCKQHG
jgi:hypothetical protein